MDDRSGHESAHPPDPGEQSGEDAPPPRGFSFPSATDASGSPAPHQPTFSLPDDTQYGTPGPPASQYPGSGGPQAADYSVPGAPDLGTPPPMVYPSPGYEPLAMPTSGGHGQPPGGGHGDRSVPPGYGQPSSGGGYGQPPPANYGQQPPGGGYGQPAGAGHGNPWGPENAGPSASTPGYGPGPAASGYGAPAGDANPGWSFSGLGSSPLGFGGQPSAGFGNQSAGPKDQLALVAMVVGLSATLLALAGCCYLAPRIVAMLAGAAAVVLGILAQQRISKSAGRLTGTPQAVIGIASGAVAIFLALLIVLVTFLN